MKKYLLRITLGITLLSTGNLFLNGQVDKSLKKEDRNGRELKQKPAPTKKPVKTGQPTKKGNKKIKTDSDVSDSLISLPFNYDIPVVSTDQIYQAEIVENRTTEPEKEKVYNISTIEQMPSFPGGTSELYKWLNNNIRYPAEAAESSIQGRVSLSFTVSKDGSIKDIEVMRSPHESLSRESIRLVKSMPKWIPGRMNGETVNVTYIMPINFRLTNL